MDIGKSFSYTLEDPEWLSKVGLGGLISMVPILSFAWQGYLTETLQNVKERQPTPLPKWDDLGKHFTDGAIFWIARLLYALPGILLLFLPFFLMLLPALSTNTDVQEILAVIGGGISLLLVGLWLIYLLLLSFLMPAVRIHFADNRTFNGCFQIREIFSVVTENLSEYLTAWGLTIVANIGLYTVWSVISSILGIIPCIGIFLTLLLIPVLVAASAWLATVVVHLFGQVVPAPSRYQTEAFS
jgi:hypothetical protein